MFLPEGPGIKDTRRQNPYLEAFHRPRVITAAKLQQLVQGHQREQGARQREQLLRSQQYPLAIDPPCLFEQATDQFLDSISPTVSDLINHTNRTHTSLTRSRTQTNNIHLSLDLARAEQVAQQGVWSVLSNLLTVGKYRQLEKVRSNNTIRIMFENFSSLCLFVQGKEKGRKIRQINKLMKE
jgi:hypothetical protein